MNIPSTSAPHDAGLDQAERLRVELGERAYDIVVGRGLIADVATEIAPRLHQPRVAVLTDRTVAGHWLAPLKQSLHGAGIEVLDIVVDSGETAKSFKQLERVTSALLEWRVERRSTLIALGGGVIGDLAGFAAAVTLRGIDFIQIPTTLLAQVDSSVGGKTAINTAFGKNLVGAFHQPRLVIADTASLDTLPRREIAAGYAEIAKYGLLGDETFFAWLEINGAGVFSGDEQARRHAILESCRAKARIVAEDERETGVRALLNLGHTFGHALEAEAGYDGSLLHGEAVAIGCILAFRLSEALGVCPAGRAERLVEHYRSLGVPHDLSMLDTAAWTAGGLLAHMGRDKKVSGGKLTFVLARDIGDAFVSRDVPRAAVLEVLETALGEAG